MQRDDRAGARPDRGSPGLRMLHASNPSPMTLDGTRSFVVGHRRAVVIDPGPATPAHLDALAAALHGAESVSVVLTHAHPDHAAAGEPLARRLGAALCMARGALAGAVPEHAIARWLEDGDALETDAGALRVVATPGHAPEHLALHWHDGAAPARGAVFVGDLMMGEGDTALVAHPEGDLAAYLRSLDRVAALGAAVFYPAHGPPIEAPAEALARYREHRHRRIEQAIGALRIGAATPARLLDAVYGDTVPAALRPAALASLLAVLRYLERQRLVRRDGDLYRLN